MKKVALLLVFAALVSSGSLRVSSDYDLKVDFSTYDSYAFFKPGIDKVEISDLDKRRILNALETALQSKGIEEVTKNSLGYLKQLQKKYPELKVPIDDGLKLLQTIK